MDIRVGIIGFGRIGAKHAEWLSRAKDIHGAAVFDCTPERRELAKSRELRAVDTIDAILGDSSIDAVLVSTTTSMHSNDASKALAARKHVMVEKPVALTYPEAEQLAALSRSAGRTLSVFQNRRWDIDFLTVKSAIEAGTFGRVFNVESRLGQWASCVGRAAKEWRPNWRNESAFGGGGLYDWGSHLVDQMLLLMQPATPKTVFAQLLANVWSSDPNCDDFARVCINFDGGANGGAIGLVEINTTTTRPLPRWHIDGERGSAESPFSLSFDKTQWAKLNFTPEPSGDEHLIAHAQPGLSETQIWERFAAACRGESEPAVTIESVLPTMRVLDAARESSRTGSAVSM
ncbi:MAG: Gfo/Idh/MocA family oxidoreductase [Anaerolineae bacterium]|nr:Gfo/Idh/MocA family oxidoreductase [Phycisphaerae bacterium]